MNRTELQKTLAGLTEEIELISDVKIKSIQKTLLNLIELLVEENDTLRKENQRLRDENNRLKGEQGKPSIRKQSNTDISSEKNRKPRGQQEKKKKIQKKNIVRHESATVLADGSTAEKVLTKHISYPALGMLQ